MFCGECGSKNRNNSKFCSNCGAKLPDYTKPKENLIMPEDIKKEQELIEKRKKVRKICNILLACFLTMAIIFTILTFFVSSALQLPFAIVSVIIYIAFFTVLIIKKKKLKKLVIKK